MLSCMKPSSSALSEDNTPRSSSSPHSPTFNLSQQYALAVQSHSYSEIRSTFYHDRNVVGIEHVNVFEEPLLFKQVLRPSHESVEEAFLPFSPHLLVRAFFEHTEATYRLCLVIYERVRHARVLYTPIHSLIDELPLDFDFRRNFLSHSQCQSAFNVFVQFDKLENPFLFPESPNLDDIRQCFSQLRQNLDPLLRKSKSTKSPLRLVAAVVRRPMCTSNATKKDSSTVLAQLDAAAVGAFVLEKELDTISSLVSRVHASVENDRLFIRPGLERGVDRFMAQEILRQMKGDRPSFLQQLVVLEEHLFLYFAVINRARSSLLQRILLRQNSV